MEQFLSAINQEITARENFEYLKQSSFDSKDESKNFTTSSLNTQARLKKCVFCKCEDHYSNQCRIITDIYTRREILKKGNICFKCLKPGHIKKNCQNKIKCFLWKKEMENEIIISHYVISKIIRSIPIPLQPILIKIIVA